jgi:hypothetical protein
MSDKKSRSKNMTKEDKLEADEKMTQLDKIVKGWEGDQAEDIAYQIPLTGKPMADVGKCRVVLEFASLSEAEAMVAECVGHSTTCGMFLMDAIAQNAVPDERTFLVRKADALPEQWQLQRITVRVTPAGS